MRSRPQDDRELEDSFKALGEEYVSVLPERLNALGKLLETAQASEDDMRAATIESHKISGTACIFGLPQISKVMAALEGTLMLAAANPDRSADLLQNEAKTHLDAAYQLLGSTSERPQ